ncbi:FISUMP domain-containing protein [Flavobacterium sp. RSB2_4_14]|uniref:FISUMP domain-containing protein n=1 Tax=Flavobacterium sp. RSB2_4_14 TaxID=3447665 RepID=UPI003F39665B
MKKFKCLILFCISINSYCQTAGNGVTDIDGNFYNSVIIGTQEWTKENLNVSKYSDGTVIPQVTDFSTWSNLTTGAWCYYENNTSYGTVYGKLYNWYAVAGIYNTASANDPNLRKKLAPQGWHIPTKIEWSTLINFLDPNSNGGYLNNVAGSKLKEVGTAHWIAPNTGATNISGFTGLPGGYINSNICTNMRYNGWWWTSNQTGSSPTLYAAARLMSYNGTSITPDDNQLKMTGYSVRCINNISLRNHAFNDSLFNIYPNPSYDKFTIDFGNEIISNYTIKINNMLGQEVYSNVIDKPQFEVSKTWQGEGLYFVKIYDDNNNLLSTKKIILQ